MKPWFGAVAAWCVGVLGALCGSPSGEETPALEESVVVTAQFEPESAKDSVYRIQVIDKARIRDQAAANLRDLLSQELGVALSQASVFGAGLALDGISQANVEILQDGMPVIGRLNGIIDLEHINLSGVARVEYITGPVSVYYGTDALAGVFHLISEEPDPGPYRVSLDGYHHSAGDVVGGARASLRRGDHAIRAHIAAKSFDGWSPSNQKRRKAWSGRDQHWGDFGYTFLWQGLKGRYQARHFEEALLDLGEPENGSAQDLSYHTRRQGHSFSIKGHVTGRTYWDMQVAYADYERYRESRQVDVASGEVLQNPSIGADLNTFDQWLARGLVSHNQMTPFLDLQWGFEMTLDRAMGERIRNGGRGMDDYAVFAGIKWRPFPKWTVQPAARFAWNDAYDAPVTPALHLKYQPSSRLDVRASYSRGFRGPDIKQLYLDFTANAGPFVYNILGNEALEAERGHHFQFALDHGRQLGWGSLHTGLSLFQSRVDNLIALSPLLPVLGMPNLFERHYLNVDFHKTKGGKLRFHLDRPRWSAEAGAAYLKTFNAFSRTATLPEFNDAMDGTMRLAYRWPKGSRLALFYKHTGSRTGFYELRNRATGTTEIRQSRIGAFDRLDISMWRGFFDDALEVGIGGKNLFDLETRDSLDQTSGDAHAVNHLDWGRSFFINARYTWRR